MDANKYFKSNIWAVLYQPPWKPVRASYYTSLLILSRISPATFRNNVLQQGVVRFLSKPCAASSQAFSVSSLRWRIFARIKWPETEQRDFGANRRVLTFLFFICYHDYYRFFFFLFFFAGLIPFLPGIYLLNRHSCIFNDSINALPTVRMLRVESSSSVPTEANSKECTFRSLWMRPIFSCTVQEFSPFPVTVQPPYFSIKLNKGVFPLLLIAVVLTHEL